MGYRMNKTNFTFDVPDLGTVRVEATDLRDALMEVADKVGIKLVGMTRITMPTKPGRAPLRLVSNRVSHR